jgi:MtN3 and saliva related transmembrane protein
MYVLFVIGISLWLLYGIVGVDWPLIIANTITLGLSLAILALKIKHLRTPAASD